MGRLGEEAPGFANAVATGRDALQRDPALLNRKGLQLR